MMDEKVPDREEFYLAVARSLAGCQLVEQALKLYISEALVLVRKRVGNYLPFKMSGEDYDNASLERLIETFKKLSDNDVIVKGLNTFKDQRNFISHKAIARYLDTQGELSMTLREWLDLKSKLGNVELKAAILEEEVRREANKVLGHLFFEPGPRK